MRAVPLIPQTLRVVCGGQRFQRDALAGLDVDRPLRVGQDRVHRVDLQTVVHLHTESDLLLMAEFVGDGANIFAGAGDVFHRDCVAFAGVDRPLDRPGLMLEAVYLRHEVLEPDIIQVVVRIALGNVGRRIHGQGHASAVRHRESRDVRPNVEVHVCPAAQIVDPQLLIKLVEAAVFSAPASAHSDAEAVVVEYAQQRDLCHLRAAFVIVPYHVEVEHRVALRPEVIYARVAITDQVDGNGLAVKVDVMEHRGLPRLRVLLRRQRAVNEQRLTVEGEGWDAAPGVHCVGLAGLIGITEPERAEIVEVDDKIAVLVDCKRRVAADDADLIGVKRRLLAAAELVDLDDAVRAGRREDRTLDPVFIFDEGPALFGPVQIAETKAAAQIVDVNAAPVVLHRGIGVPGAAEAEVEPLVVHLQEADRVDDVVTLDLDRLNVDPVAAVVDEALDSSAVRADKVDRVVCDGIAAGQSPFRDEALLGGRRLAVKAEFHQLAAHRELVDAPVGSGVGDVILAVVGPVVEPDAREVSFG